MNHTRGMRSRQRCHDLGGDVEGSIKGQPLAHEPRAQRFTINQREDEGQPAIALLHLSLIHI